MIRINDSKSDTFVIALIKETIIVRMKLEYPNFIPSIKRLRVREE